MVKDKRTQIVNSAIKLFSTNGFQSTSTTSITRNAGVGTGTLFLYFRSKEEMINQIYLEVKEEIAQEIQRGLSLQMSLKSRMQLLWNNMTKWAINNPQKFLFIIDFSNSPFINNLTKEEAIGGFRFVFELIHEGIENDIFSNINDEFIYNLINSHLFGTINYIIANNLPSELVVDQSFNVLWKGLRS